MTLRAAVLATDPTSYWPLDDAAGSAVVRDEKALNDGVPVGVALAAVPFGAARMPHFDGQLGNFITIPDDPLYSHPAADSLTVACWICPSALDFAHTDGRSPDQFVHFIHKAVKSNCDAEWAFRLYNANAPTRCSRLSFYLFNSGSPVGKGAGAYMQFGHSHNDRTPVRVGEWLFLVGQGEGWLDGCEQTRGTLLYKQGVLAERSPGDKYNNPKEWNVRPWSGTGEITVGGSIGKTAFCGAIGHLALWNRLLTADEVADMFAAGQAELAGV